MTRLKILSFLIVFIGGPAVASEFTASGTVKNLRSHNESYGTDIDWVTIEGFTSAGSCGKRSDGSVRIAIKNDEYGKRQFSTLLAAKMSNVAVTVTVDDSYKSASNTCYLAYVTL